MVKGERRSEGDGKGKVLEEPVWGDVSQRCSIKVTNLTPSSRREVLVTEKFP